MNLMVEHVAELQSGPYGHYLVSREGKKKGDIVFYLDGNEVPEADQHTIQLDEDLHLTADHELWRYTQHSCEPNMKFDMTRRVMIAVREITAGEPLTFNYNTTEWVLSTPFECGCGSDHCVGHVRGFSLLTRDEQIFLETMALPYLLNKVDGQKSATES